MVFLLPPLPPLTLLTLLTLLLFLTGMTNDEQLEIMDWARSGDVHKIEDKLDHGLQVNLQSSETGESLLMASASSGNAPLVELLFRKGAKADLEDFRGRNALHYGCKYPKIGMTIAARGASLTHADVDTGSTALHLCAAEGHVFDDLMRDLNVAPDVYDSDGKTPLHYAAENGRVVACQKLLKLGANASAVVTGEMSLHYRKTPLHLAAMTIHGMDAMRALVESGASLKALDAAGRLPLHDAAFSGAAGNVLILCEAVGGVKGVNQLDAEGFTPLHVACSGGKLGAVRALLAKGALAETWTESGMDSFGLALEAGIVAESIVMFFSKNKQIMEGMNTLVYGDNEWRPIHLAAR